MEYGTIRIKLDELLKASGLSKNILSHRAEMQRTQINNYCKNQHYSFRYRCPRKALYGVELWEWRSIRIYTTRKDRKMRLAGGISFPPTSLIMYLFLQKSSALYIFGSASRLMLRRLTPKVERLCSVAEVAGGRNPVTPRAIRAPLKPMTKR